MARQELRAPINALLEDKSKLDVAFTDLKNKYDVLSTELQRKRNEQSGYREAKETLQNTNSNKPARRVFDQRIADCQISIDETLKKLEELEKDRVVKSSQIVAISKSIKELQNA